MTIELDVRDAALVQFTLERHYADRGQKTAPQAQRIIDRIEVAAAGEQAIEEATAAYARTLVAKVAKGNR